MGIFASKDLDYMLQRGNDPQLVEKQFAYFKKGFPNAKLNIIATIDDGIAVFDSDLLSKLVLDYDQLAKDKKIVKFVPASGAATRMFKELFEAILMDESQYSPRMNIFFEQLSQYAFYNDLMAICNSENKKEILKTLLTENGLNYGNLPKAMLKFHLYNGYSRTAAEEHLVEAALYAMCQNRDCYIHFTVSPYHLEDFRNLINSVITEYEIKYKVTYHISYSIQDPNTDTLASEMDNTPFRDSKGDLLFRPGGHGALIKNLNDIKADLIFVKNIDNITKEEKLQPTNDYKKACAALLINLQEKCFSYLKSIDIGNLSSDLMKEIYVFASKDLGICFTSEQPSVAELKSKLNRPIRVCGMVKNEGEPGGGPFWVKNKKNEISCQIVESSQMNLKDQEQKTIFDQSTHFNPVDMVCSTIDYQGNHFDLHQFVDDETGFISEKSYEGRALKAMELPGLWNGAMADWITIFVEVPIETFNPVKTIFDLLKR